MESGDRNIHLDRCIGLFSLTRFTGQFTTLRLEHIDTVTRAESLQEVLSWTTAQNIKYLSYGDMDVSYPVGSTMVVFVER